MLAVGLCLSVEKQLLRCQAVKHSAAQVGSALDHSACKLPFVDESMMKVVATCIWNIKLHNQDWLLPLSAHNVKENICTNGFVVMERKI